LGRSGWSIHALAIETHPLFTLVAVTDPEPDRRGEAEQRFGCRAYESFEALAGDADAELVVVATPSHQHAPMSCAALRAGKHVLVEKPMALTAAEADEMLACARSSGRILTVYQIRRLDPDFLKIREIVEKGLLGPLHEIRTGAYGYDRRCDWQTLSRFGGGQLNNNGSHLIDQVLILAGGGWSQPFADLRQVACAGDAEDHAKVVFRGSSGAVVDVELAVSAFGTPKWLIMGKYGSLTGDTKRIEWKYYDPSTLPEPVASEAAAPGRRYGSGETIPWITDSAEFQGGDTRPQFYDRLYASIREGAPLLVPPEEVRSVVALLEACHAQTA
jgi:predicted dehydrogenase